MRPILRPLAAEFLGTFALVFIGAGVVVVDAAEGGALGLEAIALAHALVLAVMVTATMNISGGHINPAVTVGLWVARKIDGKMAGLYVLTQVVAAVAAALLVRALFPPLAGEVTGYGVPRISAEFTFMDAVWVEAILTFFLVSAVFGTAASSQAPRVGGFGIGLVLLFDILVGGPLTGAAVNPARAFGPALVAQEWHGHAVFWIGPVLGGLAAGVLWRYLLLPREEELA
jgi:MIP family channel proteins